MSRSRIWLSDGDSRHGTINGYNNLKCRCDICRAAWADYLNRRRHERANGLPVDDPRHGRYTTYLNHMCRCDMCRAASTIYRRIKKRESRRRAYERATP